MNKVKIKFSKADNHDQYVEIDGVKRFVASLDISIRTYNTLHVEMSAYARPADSNRLTYDDADGNPVMERIHQAYPLDDLEFTLEAEGPLTDTPAIEEL